MVIANPYNYQKPKQYVQVKKQQPEIKAVPNKTKSDVYLEQKIMNSKPEELTYMLYEGIVKFIKIAKIHVLSKDVPKSNDAIQRAQAIISELQATLDMDYEISDNLSSLYDFMYQRLFDANLAKDDQMLDEVLDLAEDMRDTWKEAMALL